MEVIKQNQDRIRLIEIEIEKLPESERSNFEILQVYGKVRIP
jgi:hypothetical protein